MKGSCIQSAAASGTLYTLLSATRPNAPLP